jgi:hypothetical protein
MKRRISLLLLSLALIAAVSAGVSGSSNEPTQPEARCGWVFYAFYPVWKCIPGNGGGGGRSW